VPLLAEIFRELGYEGATLSRITARTGIGKGSLYHFFPGGKEEMAAAVLAEVDRWFEEFIYEPLSRDEPSAAIDAMWRGVDDYFRSGARICLVGAFALGGTRERFSAAIDSYFRRWVDALAGALVRGGQTKIQARDYAEATVLGIQGALVLSRAVNQNIIFTRAIDRMRKALKAS
jgi:AcrR family transcriptional regulator